MHIKKFYDESDYLNESDFPAPREVTIFEVAPVVLEDRKTKKPSKSPVLYVTDKAGAKHPRGYKIPKSVGYGLGLMLGTECEAWKGKKITLFATRCMSFGQIEPCIRCKFPPEIDQRVRAWMKKRGSSESAYMLPEDAK